MTNPKINRNFFYFLLFFYESFHTIFIAISSPQSIITVLPLSWYSTMPLLFIPFVLIFNMYTKTKEAPFCSFLYRLTKITILIGFVAFLHDFLPLIQQNIDFQRQTNLLTVVYICQAKAKMSQHHIAR